MSTETPPPGILALPNGQWTVEGDTHLGKWAFEHGSIVTDPHLFRWLKPYLEGCGVVFDIGANIGDHTRQYLDWGMQVVAFEPHPVAHECLAHNCPEAQCLNLAVSDVAGTVNFSTHENVGASRISKDGEWSVPAVRLDDLVIEGKIPSPDFVKIDIEGHELSALRGAFGTLVQSSPVIFCEVNRGALAANGHTPADLFQFFRELGYSDSEGRMLIYPGDALLDSDQFDVLLIP